VTADAPTPLEEPLSPPTTYIDSAALARFRDLITAHPTWRAIGGDLLRYSVVIDANIAIADLLHKHKFPRRQTAIEETIKAGVLCVHAPRWLDKEIMNSAIPAVSLRRKIPEQELRELWIKYREQLVWEESFSTPEQFAQTSGNPKDMPYVALQAVVSAAGVLTKDRGIAALGGKPLNLDFVFSIQQYARASTVYVGIRFGGTIVGWLSVAALVEGIRGLASVVGRLPPWAKVSLLVGALTIVLHPRLRERVLDMLRGTGATAELIWPEFQRLMVLMQEKQEEADAARENAALLLRGSFASARQSL
jgi:hypothetical protein